MIWRSEKTANPAGGKVGNVVCRTFKIVRSRRDARLQDIEDKRFLRVFCRDSTRSIAKATETPRVFVETVIPRRGLDGTNEVSRSVAVKIPGDTASGCLPEPATLGTV